MRLKENSVQKPWNRLLSTNLSKFCLLVLWTPSFEGNWVSLMGFILTAGIGVDGNAPYQAQELQITTLANPVKQANLLFNLFKN